MPLVLFLRAYFLDKLSHFCPADLEPQSSYLYLPSSWNHRCAPPYLAGLNFLLKGDKVVEQHETKTIAKNIFENLGLSQGQTNGENIDVLGY
jgi:hypothetical protein